MLRHGIVHGSQRCIAVMALLLLAACTDQLLTPVDTPDVRSRRLQLAFPGDMGVKILINGQKLNDQGLASRLRVEIAIDGPTFVGDATTKTIAISPTHTQADSVAACSSCDAHVLYDDLWGDVTPGAARGTLADGDYTVKLYRDGSTLLGSIGIAVNHADYSSSNGTFLDETSDQIVTFYLNGNLQEVSSPTVSDPHTRASTHLSASIVQPAGSDTTITVGTSLTVQGSASDGLTGTTKKYAWAWNASGGNEWTSTPASPPTSRRPSRSI